MASKHSNRSPELRRQSGSSRKRTRPSNTHPSSAAGSGRRGGGEGEAEVESQSPLSCCLKGIRDALNVVTPVQCLYNCPEVLRNTKSCLVLNGFIFLGSIVMYEYGLYPLLTAILSVTGPLVTGSGERMVQLAVHALYNLGWIYPMYFCSKVLNNFCYQDIADETYDYVREDRRSRRPAKPSSVGEHKDIISWLSSSIADVIYTFVLELILLAQIGVMGFVPTIGRPLSFAYTCWLTSLYCFEYKWIKEGWTVNRRLDYLERHWAYFFGFGLPFTLITFFASFFVSAAIFSMLFPYFIMVAVVGTPLPSLKEDSPIGPLTPTRIPICFVARRLTNRLMKVVPSQTAK